MRLMGKLLLLSLLLATGLCRVHEVSAAAPQQAAPVTVDVTLDKTRATVGDPIGVTISIHYDSGVNVNADGIVTQLAPFEAIASDPPNDQHAANGSGVLKLQFKVAAYQTGSLQFPALTVAYTAAGQTGSTQTQPIPFTVDSVIPADDKGTDIHPLKPQLSLPLPGTPPLIWIAALAALAILAVALTAVLWRRRRAALETLAPQILITGQSEAEARVELERIVAERYLEQGDYRTHYALLAACIRRYITRSYGFAAVAMTTSELTERMVLSGVGRWRARLVADLLAECDAVYYAHYLPAPARAEADLQMAFEIVDLTLSHETRPNDARVELGG